MRLDWFVNAALSERGGYWGGISGSLALDVMNTFIAGNDRCLLPKLISGELCVKDAAVLLKDRGL